MTRKHLEEASPSMELDSRTIGILIFFGVIGLVGLTLWLKGPKRTFIDERGRPEDRLKDIDPDAKTPSWWRF